jgi:hypothetical protein
MIEAVMPLATPWSGRSLHAWAVAAQGGSTPNIAQLRRHAQARTREALDTAITGAMATITDADARGWFRHGGDALRSCEKR